MYNEEEWRPNRKIKGRNMPNATFRMEDAFMRALKRLSEKETVRCGVTISQAVILKDLSTRGSNFHQQKRTELKKLWEEELNKDNQHDKQETAT